MSEKHTITVFHRETGEPLVTRQEWFACGKHPNHVEAKHAAKAEAKAERKEAKAKEEKEEAREEVKAAREDEHLAEKARKAVERDAEKEERKRKREEAKAKKDEQETPEVPEGKTYADAVGATVTGEPDEKLKRSKDSGTEA